MELLGFARTVEREVAVWRHEERIYVANPEPPHTPEGVHGARSAPYAIREAARGDLGFRMQVGWRDAN